MGAQRSKNQPGVSGAEVIDEKLMKKIAIVMCASFVISLPVLFLFNSIDAWFMTFGSCLAVAMSIRMLNSKKLAIVAVPAYIAVATAIYYTLVSLSGLEKPPDVQVSEITILIAIIAVFTGSYKVLFIDSNKQRGNRVQPS